MSKKTLITVCLLICMLSHAAVTAPTVKSITTHRDADEIIKLVSERYTKGPLVMKGEYFRNWSHIEAPFAIHIQTRSIMGEGLLASVFYECIDDEKKLVAGVMYNLNEVIEFADDGSLNRYTSPTQFGSNDNDYQDGCTTMTAWCTWIGSDVLLNLSESDEWQPGYFISTIEHASNIQQYELGWVVFEFSSSRIEELDILSDGSIEVWRSRTLPAVEGAHSSLERQFQWFDLPVEDDVLREELAKCAESPDLKSLETLILKHVKLAEEADASTKAEEAKANEVSSEGVVSMPLPAAK